MSSSSTTPQTKKNSIKFILLPVIIIILTWLVLLSLKCFQAYRFYQYSMEQLAHLQPTIEWHQITAFPIAVHGSIQLTFPDTTPEQLLLNSHYKFLANLEPVDGLQTKIEFSAQETLTINTTSIYPSPLQSLLPLQEFSVVLGLTKATIDILNIPHKTLNLTNNENLSIKNLFATITTNYTFDSDMLIEFEEIQVTTANRNNDFIIQHGHLFLEDLETTSGNSVKLTTALTIVINKAGAPKKYDVKTNHTFLSDVSKKQIQKLTKQLSSEKITINEYLLPMFKERLSYLVAFDLLESDKSLLNLTGELAWPGNPNLSLSNWQQNNIGLFLNAFISNIKLELNINFSEDLLAHHPKYKLFTNALQSNKIHILLANNVLTINGEDRSEFLNLLTMRAKQTQKQDTNQPTEKQEINDN